ncbi:hypothetical protein [Roseovarius tolerans]|uniref:hypothetical protein n=1 Tax=Roseovarius tolerans TaxID=74031 RepID=UPI0011139B19|nr:hypothetical protein [Roseovarius tolerans]
MSDGSWLTADYALIISLFSLCLAFAAFVWNVWSKFIFPKAKVRVFLSVVHCDLATGHIIAENNQGDFPGGWSKSDLEYPCVRISATNFGPGAIKLQSAIAKKSRFSTFSPGAVGLLNPYNNYPSNLSSNGPFSGGLPANLEVGEEFSVYFPIEPAWTSTENLTKFGFLDVFGRYHYCKTRDVQSLRRAVFRHGKEAAS